MSLTEEILGSLNGRLMDIQWRLVYSVASKTLNKLYQPRFLITLKVLTDGFGVQGYRGSALDDGTLHEARIQDLEFECTREELTYLLGKVKSALAVFE